MDIENIPWADGGTYFQLVSMNVIYADESGFHCGEPGAYPRGKSEENRSGCAEDEKEGGQHGI